MQVVGQDHDRLDREWAHSVRGTKHRTQIVDLIEQQGSPPFQQVHGEEVVNRPAFRRHLEAIIDGNDRGVHEQQTIFG